MQAGDVDFEADVKPYMFLYREDDSISPFWMSMKKEQRDEIHSLGTSVEERREKLKVALQFSMNDACKRLGFDGILSVFSNCCWYWWGLIHVQ